MRCLRRFGCLWLGLCVVATSTSAQTQGKPAGAAPSNKPNTATLPCPDKVFEKACKSFQELKAAGDDGVKPTSGPGGLALVCFRQPADEFFIVDVDGPHFWSKTAFDKAKKALVPDDEATSRAFGWMRGFVNGVEDGSQMPVRSIDGEWQSPNYSLFFAATKINRAAVDDNTTLFLDSSQFSVSVRYPNRMDKKVDYRLVIQRSTGRFAESYTMESEKIPFSEAQGRCSRLSVK
jgi:hypothetical protein